MHRALIATILAATGLLGSAQAATAESRPVVVELFTSQGCSSCPPADAFLGELAKRKDVLALGFHVDYWDSLGWKDPFAAPGATARQHAYAAQFGRKEVYTPQMVIDGRFQLVGSYRDEVLRAIAAAKPETAAQIDFAADGREVRIGGGSGDGRILIVRYVHDRTTPVARGENAGATAHDVNAVEKLTEAGRWTGQPITLPVDALAPGHGVAALIQSDDGRILGAAAVDAPNG
jgi:hypothetical protein